MNQLSQDFEASLDTDESGELPSLPISDTSLPDSSKQKNKAAQQQKPDMNISAKEALGAFGFGILLSWVVLCYFSNIIATSINPEQVLDVGIMKIVGLVSFGTIFTLFLPWSDYLATVSLSRLSLIILILGAVLPICAIVSGIGVALPAPLVYCAWGINGAASAFTFLMAANYYSGLSRNIIVVSIVLTCLIASFWTLLISFLPSIVQIVGIYLSLPICIGCLMIFVGETAPLEFVSRKDSELIIGLNVRTSVSLVCIGIAAGFLLYKILFEQSGEAVFIIGAAFLCNAAASYLVSKVSGQYSLLIASVFRFGFPLTIVGLILLPFLEGYALMVCEALLLATYIEHWVASFINISFAIQKYKIQAFYLWIRVNLTVIVGAAAGWVLGFIAYIQIISGFFGSHEVILAFSLAFILLFAIAITITPYGIDHLTLRRNFEAKSKIDDELSMKKAWWDACTVMAEQSHLTPRETEVFYLLAKGRNSKIIERELSISTHTVKSHNYNIYRKVGVKSQQELIDTIESSRSELKNK